MPTVPLPRRLCIAASVSLASCAVPAPSADAINEVRAAHAQLIAAFNTCDEAAFSGAYAEGFTFTTSNTRTAIVTLNGLRGYLASACRQSPSPQVTLTSQSIRTVGQNVAASGQYTFRVAGGAGGVTEIRQNYTLLMQHLPEGWRISAHHVSIAP